MNLHPITRAAGATAGGLLTAAVLPVAMAFGDTYDFVPDPANPLVVGDVSGIPPFFQEIQGTAHWETNDVSGATPVTVGTFDVDESQITGPGGFESTDAVVFSDVSGTDNPGVGSVFDTITFGGSGFVNEYSDIIQGSGVSATSAVTDTLVTPFGFDIDLTPIVDAFGINPADFIFAGA